MAAVAVASPKQQFLDGAGMPLAMGFVHTYLAGTSTESTTWQDRDQQVENENPIPLNEYGAATIMLAPALAYRFEVTDALGAVQPHLGGDNIFGAASSSSVSAVIAAGLVEIEAAKDAAIVEMDALVGDAETAQAAAEAAVATAAASAKLYPDYATAVAATSDGDYFGVYSSSLAVRYIYKRVSGQGELQAVRPYFNQFEAETARKLASAQTFDTAKSLPSGTLVDFVAVEAMFSVDAVKNRADSASAVGLNMYGRSRPTEFPAGTFGGQGNTAPALTLGIAGADAALKAIKAVYGGVGTSVLGVQANTMGAASFSVLVPAGRWTLAYDVISNSGSSVTYRMHGNGTAATYGNATATTSWSTVSQTFVQSADTSLALQLFREAAVPAAVDITIDNVRLIPGSSPGAASASNVHLYRPQGLSTQSGMVVRGTSNTDNGARLVAPLTASTAFTGVTVVAAVRREGAGANQNYIASDSSASAAGFYLRDNCASNVQQPGLDAGLNAVDSDMVGLPLNDWIIVASAAGPDGSSMYVNDMKVTPTTATAYAGFSADFMSLHGLAARQDANFIGKSASVILDDRRMTDAELLRVIAVMKARIAAMGERFTDYGTFYIAEGDSLTAGTGGTAARGYAKLLGKNFTPYLQGISYAVAGNVLSQLTARASTVDAKIAEAIAQGKRVVFSVLIGTNELPATNPAADTYYAALKVYWAARRATGAKVIASTIPLRSDATAGQIATLPYLNGLITGDATQYDGVANYAANANLYNGFGSHFADTTHWNDTGHALAETILRPVVTTLWLP